MRQRIDLGDLYQGALKQAAQADDDSGARRILPHDCPYGLDDLLTRDPDLDRLVAKLAA